MSDIKKGSNVTIVSGSRFRRLSDDGKTMMDKGLNEGVAVEQDKLASVLHVVETPSAAPVYVVSLKHDGQELQGWVYAYELIPSVQERL